MRAFVTKQKPNQEAKSAGSERLGRAFSRQGRELNLIPDLHRSIENHTAERLPEAHEQKPEDESPASALAHFRHDFSRIPVHADARTTIQPKLQVNTPGDTHELQADQVAEQVMRMPEPRLQRTCACGGGCPRCQNEKAIHEQLQTKRVEANDIGEVTAPSIVHEVLRSSGQPLDPDTREFMEARFGHNFSRVRVHADAQSAESAVALNALAYTVGHDMVFGAGQYNPTSSQGKHLLAHELTHTIQQGRGLSSSRIQRSGPDADKANSLMNYLTKLRETGKIQNDKTNAREVVKRWKLGHSVAVLSLAQKKLVIDELLNGPATVAVNDQSLILDLVELSEVVHTKELCEYLAPKIKSSSDKIPDSRKIFTAKTYKRFQDIQQTRAKAQDTSGGTFSSDQVRIMIERAYINAIRYAKKENIDSDFVKFSDSENYLHCIDTFRRVVLFRLFGNAKDSPLIEKTVNEYCLSGKLKDEKGAPRANRIMDAMDAMIKVGHAKKLKSFSYSHKSQKFESLKSKKDARTLNVPDKLQGSVWGTMKTEFKNKEGWHFFPLTVLDGYHSITLAVDIRPDGPFLYWIDDLDKTKQPESEKFRVTEGSAPGVRQLIPDQLDSYISWTTQSYWEVLRTDPTKKDGPEGWHDENNTTILWGLFPEKI